MKVLVTGGAGFIGFHTAMRLIERVDDIVVVDVVNDYYDPKLKWKRLGLLDEAAAGSTGSYRFHQANLADKDFVARLFAEERFDRVIHLAAQAGVRHSLVDPLAYVESNVVAFTNILEGCRHNSVGHLTYASTSSVYGANAKMPFSEHDGVDHPLQFYAATKRANELMAHSYSHLFGLPTSGLRFFTVYGPWGRPDMALFLFADAILEGRPVSLFNGGNHVRDFTYVDDIVEGVIRVSDTPTAADPDWNAATPDPSSSNAPFRLLNIGNGNPVALSNYLDALENALGRKATRVLLPLQPGDVIETVADTSALEELVGSWPRTSVDEGVARFVDWYLAYRSSGVDMTQPDVPG